MRAALIGLAILGLLGCGASPPAEQPLPGGPAGQAVLRFRPAWIPEQVVEVKRWVDPGKGLQVRDFQPPPHIQPGPRVSFAVSTTGAAVYGAAGDERTPVDVNGITGRLIARPDPSFGTAQVDWVPAPGVRIAVKVDRLPEEADVALRMARSAVPDSSPMFGGDPIRVGWLPGAGALGPLAIEGTSPTDWSVEQLAGDVVLRIRANGCQQPENLPPVRVRSTTGWYFHDPAIKVPRHQLFVPLDEGKCLVVSGLNSQDELVRVADSAQLRPTNTAWLGTR